MNFLKIALRQSVKRGLINDDHFAELKLRFTPVDHGFQQKMKRTIALA